MAQMVARSLDLSCMRSLRHCHATDESEFREFGWKTPCLRGLSQHLPRFSGLISYPPCVAAVLDASCHAGVSHVFLSAVAVEYVAWQSELQFLTEQCRHCGQQCLLAGIFSNEIHCKQIHQNSECYGTIVEQWHCQDTHRCCDLLRLVWCKSHQTKQSYSELKMCDCCTQPRSDSQEHVSLVCGIRSFFDEKQSLHNSQGHVQTAAPIS